MVTVSLLLGKYIILHLELIVINVGVDNRMSLICESFLDFG